MDRTVVSRRQDIEVEAKRRTYERHKLEREEVRARMNKNYLVKTKTLESVKSEYKYSDELMSMERAVLSRAQYTEVSFKKIRDLVWKASWLKVNDREMDQLREDKESAHSIWLESIELEKYKGKVMIDIMNKKDILRKTSKSVAKEADGKISFRR